VTVNRLLHCDGSPRKVRGVTSTPMTATLRVTEVYPEITVADAHPERSQTQEVGHNRTAASKTQPKKTGAELKSSADRSRSGAEEHSRQTLRERVVESERPKAKNKY